MLCIASWSVSWRCVYIPCRLSILSSNDMDHCWVFGWWMVWLNCAMLIFRFVKLVGRRRSKRRMHWRLSWVCHSPHENMMQVLPRCCVVEKEESRSGAGILFVLFFLFFLDQMKRIDAADVIIRLFCCSAQTKKSWLKLWLSLKYEYTTLFG